MTHNVSVGRIQYER